MMNDVIQEFDAHVSLHSLQAESACLSSLGGQR